MPGEIDKSRITEGISTFSSPPVDELPMSLFSCALKSPSPGQWHCSTTASRHRLAPEASAISPGYSSHFAKTLCNLLSLQQSHHFFAFLWRKIILSPDSYGQPN